MKTIYKIKEEGDRNSNVDRDFNWKQTNPQRYFKATSSIASATSLDRSSAFSSVS